MGCAATTQPAACLLLSALIVRWTLLLSLTACGRLSFDPQPSPTDAISSGDSGIDTPTGPQLVASLASTPRTLVLDGTNLYWTNAADEVSQCAKSSCIPLRLVGFQPGCDSLAVDATHVYFANYNFQNNSEVKRCAIGGCGGTTTTVADTQTPLVLAINATDVYWTNFNQQTIATCPKTGCAGTATVLGSSITNAWGIALDSTTVYFSQDQGAGRIQSCPLAGCGAGPATVINSQINPSDLLVEGPTLYWSESGVGRIHRCQIADCANTEITLVAGQDNPNHLVLYGGTLYWNDGQHTLRSIPASGGTSDVIIDGESELSGIAVDATTIYWTRTNAIMKIAK